MAAGVTDRVWEIGDIVKLLDGEREQRIHVGTDKAKRSSKCFYNPTGTAMGQ
jgi:hypothetical protein